MVTVLRDGSEGIKDRWRIWFQGGGKWRKCSTASYPMTATGTRRTDRERTGQDNSRVVVEADKRSSRAKEIEHKQTGYCIALISGARINVMKIWTNINLL